MIILSITLFLLLTACQEKRQYTEPQATKAEREEPSTKQVVEQFATEDPKLVLARERMVNLDLKGRDITNEKVLAVMGRIPRQNFVPEDLKHRAYEDSPLPIGYGQTISQPYIVALMTQELNLTGNERVLEIGTGSGYQATILAEIVPEVYTIEIVEALAKRANATLQKQGYKNVQVLHGDGYFGWKEKAPFDRIIVTAAANHIPPPLLEQLKPGGKLIVPLGDITRFQTLTLATKQENGELDTRFITGVRFVPLTSKALEK